MPTADARLRDHLDLCLEIESIGAVLTVLEQRHGHAELVAVRRRQQAARGVALQYLRAQLASESVWLMMPIATTTAFH